MAKQSIPNTQHPLQTKMEYWVFWSRWLQAPMYFGLIIAQVLYVYKFGNELYHMVSHITTLKETEVLLMVLGLVDVVMVANLLLMVIVGGYETFVSRLYLDDHPDKPEWLGHVDAGMLKIKLAMSLITISSIHLLKTFIDSVNIPNDKIYAQIAIHVAFLVSALALAYADKLMDGTSTSHKPDGN
jgi:uncharacterized protein (TIGR00645 family)